MKPLTTFLTAMFCQIQTLHRYPCCKISARYSVQVQISHFNPQEKVFQLVSVNNFENVISCGPFWLIMRLKRIDLNLWFVYVGRWISPPTCTRPTTCMTAARDPNKRDKHCARPSNKSLYSSVDNLRYGSSVVKEAEKKY